MKLTRENEVTIIAWMIERIKGYLSIKTKSPEEKQQEAAAKQMSPTKRSELLLTSVKKYMRGEISSKDLSKVEDIFMMESPPPPRPPRKFLIFSSKETPQM